MISRAAESCFWLHRYVERAETTARALEVNRIFVLDVSLPELFRWRPMIVTAGEEPRFLERAGAAAIDDGEAVQRYLVWDEGCPVSIRSSLRGARDNARTIRETISHEMWETLNALWLWFGSRRARSGFERARSEFYSRVRDGCLLFHGVCHNTMPHEEPFDFMRLGMQLERAGLVARILDVRHHALRAPRQGESAAGNAQWLAILRSCAAVEAYLRKNRRPLSGTAVAEFLVFEETFPRSLRHCLMRAWNFLARIMARGRPEIGERAAEIVRSLVERIDALPRGEVLERRLHDELTWIIARTAEACDAVHADYFDRTVPAGEPEPAARGGGGGA